MEFLSNFLADLAQLVMMLQHNFSQTRTHTHIHNTTMLAGVENAPAVSPFSLYDHLMNAVLWNALHLSS